MPEQSPMFAVSELHVCQPREHHPAENDRPRRCAHWISIAVSGVRLASRAREAAIEVAGAA